VEGARGSLPDALAAPAPPPSARRWANEAYARCPARWRAARRDDPSGLPVDAHCAPRLDAQDGTLVWTAQVTVYAGSFRALGRDDPDRLPRDLLAVVARTYATFLAAETPEAFIAALAAVEKKLGL
jgi:hypothetical protein